MLNPSLGGSGPASGLAGPFFFMAQIDQELIPKNCPIFPSIYFVERQSERFESQCDRCAQTARHNTGGQKRVKRATIITSLHRSVFFP